MAQNGKVGRPSLVRGWAGRVRDILSSSPGLSTAEIVRRLRLFGCPVGKTALYHLVALCRLGDPEERRGPNRSTPGDRGRSAAARPGG